MTLRCIICIRGSDPQSGRSGREGCERLNCNLPVFYEQRIRCVFADFRLDFHRRLLISAEPSSSSARFVGETTISQGGEGGLHASARRVACQRNDALSICVVSV